MLTRSTSPARVNRSLSASALAAESFSSSASSYMMPRSSRRRETDSTGSMSDLRAFNSTISGWADGDSQKPGSPIRASTSAIRSFFLGRSKTVSDRIDAIGQLFGSESSVGKGHGSEPRWLSIVACEVRPYTPLEYSRIVDHRQTARMPYTPRTADLPEYLNGDCPR